MISQKANLFLFSIAALVSSSVSAVVVNTINGTVYEWMELSVTEGLSRIQVESMLEDPGSALYGYEYASRALIKDLFLSYSSWDGIDGVHYAPSVVEGLNKFVTDFGYTFSTADRLYSRGFFGLPNECAVNSSCQGGIDVVLDEVGAPIAAVQSAWLGWSDTTSDISVWQDSSSTGRIGSFLVKVSPVPVPAAVWLFVSGLIGMIGIIRNRIS